MVSFFRNFCPGMGRTLLETVFWNCVGWMYCSAFASPICESKRPPNIPKLVSTYGLVKCKHTREVGLTDVPAMHRLRTHSSPWRLPRSPWIRWPGATGTQSQSKRAQLPRWGALGTNCGAGLIGNPLLKRWESSGQLCPNALLHGRNHYSMWHCS